MLDLGFDTRGVYVTQLSMPKRIYTRITNEKYN